MIMDNEITIAQLQDSLQGLYDARVAFHKECYSCAEQIIAQFPGCNRVRFEPVRAKKSDENAVCFPCILEKEYDLSDEIDYLFYEITSCGDEQQRVPVYFEDITPESLISVLTQAKAYCESTSLQV